MFKPSRVDLRGAAAGVLAAAGGVGASMLLAALLGSASSTIYALGTSVIGITPAWLKDFAVEKFGTNDKTILLGSVFVVMALASAVVGIVATRRARLGLVLTAVLNLIAIGGAAKTLNGLDLSASTLLPGLLGLVVSVALMWFFIRSWRGSDTADAAAPTGFDRRVFLEAALAGGGLAVVGGGASQFLGSAGASSREDVKLPKAINTAPAVPTGAQVPVKGVTPYLTSNKDFYRIDVALKLPQIDADKWRLKIHGMVDKEIELSYRDVLAMPLEEHRFTLTCVSNQVGDSYVGNAVWLGVPFEKLLKEVGVKDGADCVISTSDDDMTITTPVKALTDGRPALLAVGMNGEPLPIKHGFPVRMVVPGLYGYVSATKWLVDLELTTFDKANTYWTQRSWAKQAPIKTLSRIDVPKQFSSASRGTVNIAGVAWAQQRGIAKVEVKIDDRDWQEAKLGAEDNIDSWREWYLPWQADKAGQYKITVRATDKTGYTQTSDRVPPRPDGATGLHTTTVNVQ